MTRSTTSNRRSLNHTIPSPLLLRKILAPLTSALQASIEREKEQSWFPKFSVLAHLLCGIVFQIAQHRSMRELLTVMNLKRQNDWLRGFHPKRSTFSDANNSKRRLKVIQKVFANLVTQCDLLPRSFRKFARLAALDSSLLHCVPSAQWATYRKNVNACKAHLLLDLASSIPKKLILTVGRMHDRKLFPDFLEKGWTYIVDRAYNDYKLFDWMNGIQIFFVTRLKTNARYAILQSRKIKKSLKKKGILKDLVISLGSGPTKMESELRLVVYQTEEGKIYHFLTNRFDLSPVTIAQMYQARWAIEIFFKWLKRTLSMERSLGRSEVGMEIHVLITLITDILLKIIAGIPRKYQHIPVKVLRIIRENLFTVYTRKLVIVIQKEIGESTD
jgi:putative transposase